MKNLDRGDYMFRKVTKLKSNTFYKEDLLKIERIIKEKMEFRKEEKTSIEIQLNLKEQILKFNSMEDVFKKMNELQIISTDKLEISALVRKSNGMRQHINILYYSNYGTLTISDEDELWVKGMQSILLESLNTMRKNYFMHKYRIVFLILFPLVSGTVLGIGISDAIKFFIVNNSTLVLSALLFILLGLSFFYITISGKLIPFVKIYFHSKNEKKSFDGMLIVAIVTLIATVVLGVLQIILL